MGLGGTGGGWPVSAGGFTPGKTQAVDVGGPAVTISVNAADPLLRLLNCTEGLVFVRFGTGPQTATVTDFPMLPVTAVMLVKGVGANTVSLIAEAHGIVYVTTGTGT